MLFTTTMLLQKKSFASITYSEGCALTEELCKFGNPAGVK